LGIGGHIAPRSDAPEYADPLRETAMRAELEAVANEIRSSLDLLRRHL
jgi:hypothetical protein